ncbi:DUF2470 domain-containing protein [Rhodococcus aerolatus]
MRHPATTPSHAEQVRTVSARTAGAVLALGGADPLASPVHLLRDGSGGAPEVLLLAPREHPVAELAGRHPGGTGLLEVTDTAPVALREPVRGLAWLRGTVHAVAPRQQRSLALLLAARHPVDALLDVGRGATLLRVVVGSAVLADASGAAAVTAADLAAAAPDPFTDVADAWLRHLDTTHRDLIGALARHLPPTRHRGVPRPLALDRWGLTLRVEAPPGSGPDVDVRLGFAAPVRDTASLQAALRALAGCPLRRGLTARSARPTP